MEDFIRELTSCTVKDKKDASFGNIVIPVFLFWFSRPVSLCLSAESIKMKTTGKKMKYFSFYILS